MPPLSTYRVLQRHCRSPRSRRFTRCSASSRSGAAARGRPRGHRSFESDEAVISELVMYADNVAALYPQKQAIRAALLKKVKAGKFDPKKAVTAFRYFADSAAKMYAWEFDTRTPGARYWHQQKGYNGFDVSARNGAAGEWAREFVADLRGHGNSWQRLAREYGLLGAHGLRG